MYVYPIAWITEYGMVTDVLVSASWITLIISVWLIVDSAVALCIYVDGNIVTIAVWTTIIGRQHVCNSMCRKFEYNYQA